MNTLVPLNLHNSILWIGSVCISDELLVRVTIRSSNGYAIRFSLVTSRTTRYLPSLKTMSVPTDEVRYILDKNPSLQSPGGMPPTAEIPLFHTQLLECQRFQSYRFHTERSGTDTSVNITCGVSCQVVADLLLSVLRLP